MKRIDWMKVLANSGLTLLTTLGGILTFNALSQGDIPINILIPAAISCSLIQGGIAFCKEILKVTEVSKLSNKGLITLTNSRKKKYFNILDKLILL